MEPHYSANYKYHLPPNQTCLCFNAIFQAKRVNKNKLWSWLCSLGIKGLPSMPKGSLEGFDASEMG